MQKNLIALLVVAVVVVGGYLLLKGPSVPAPSPTPSVSRSLEGTKPVAPKATETPSSSSGVSQGSNVVTYTDAGYTPRTLRVRVGDTVTFRNASTRSMWTASDLHPSHALYDGTSLGEHCQGGASSSFDECGAAQPGEEWSFTFRKVGTWNYHNHRSPADTGTIIVE